MKLLKVMILALLIVPARVCWGWFAQPRAVPNGWYWMYDNVEEGPPFASPELDSLPEFLDITEIGTKIPPSNDIPYVYILPDSFWFYEVWYEPGDTLYISPDGWLSFDSEAAAGQPDPPPDGCCIPISTTPNALIIPLWQDHDPTLEPGGSVVNNRVYYFYDPEIKSLIVEWFQVEGTYSGNTYTFEAMLALGGQDLLIEWGECGTVFSYHFIHFLYSNSSGGWGADNIHLPPAVGIEDEDGSYGIYYDIDVGTGLADGRVLRAGYKRVFKHDVAVTNITLDPGFSENAGDTITVRAMVENMGEEPERAFSVTCRILDMLAEPGEVIWQNSVGVDSLYPPFPDYGYLYKSEVVFPEFVTPQDGGMLVEVFTYIDEDECRFNDTARVDITAVVEDKPLYQGFELEIHSSLIAFSNCKISFTVPRTSRVEVAVFDVAGRQVESLANEISQPGEYSRIWDRTDEAGRRVAAGIYLVRMEAEEFSSVRKIVLLK